MELLLLVFFCLLTGSEVTFGAENETTVIIVEEGRDVTLPCSLREDITNKKFVWKKDGRQVFLYDDENHSNNVGTGQDQQFIGRVSHFPDKLKSGDASITISNMKVTDSGLYTCEFPDLQPRQIFYAKLIVYVEAPKPSVTKLEQTKFSAVLQCEVRGAFPKPKLHWEDGDGNKLPAGEPQESERGGLYDIVLQTTVTKTDYYRCVATQEEINYKTDDETYVFTGLTAGEKAAIVIVPLLVGLAVCIIIFLMKVKAKPSVRILNQTQDWALLLCEVRGAFPKPELHWEDGAGNKLKAEEPQVTERGGLYDIILQTTVTETDNYRCVVTQKEICHRTHADIYVYFPDQDPKKTETTVRVDEGSDVILSCSLNTKEDITNKKFEWKKDGRQVFLYDKAQDQQFKERISHFPDELKSGNASIIIRNMKVDDSGLYTCEFPNLQPRQIFYMRLIVDVEKTVIRVEEGSDVILPCSLNTKEDITNKKFEWKKDGHQVFLYDEGSLNDNNSQTQQFRGRVSHFPDELKSGNASIIIRDIKVADSGEYICEFPKQKFRIQLVVAPTAPGNGSDQDPKKTETTIIVEEGSDVMLPCSLNTKEDITNKKFEWKKDGHQLFLHDKGQRRQFKGEVVLVPDKLKSGITSIIIRNTTAANRGLYTCEFPDLQPRQIFLIQLDVGTKVTVDEGKDAILPCSLREDITNKKFVWKKAGLQMFLYDKGQYQPFKERISRSDKQNASITIRNTRVADSGGYICEFPDLQKIFYVRLIVLSAQTALGDGSAQDPKKTDGSDDGTTSPLMTDSV